ncbi:hypothetical protein BCAR13_440064 [Paraburkholderia caribensis]|nr:hypothetical protein BCAR13_440064 [Paraburkholderia caribensis]
MHPISTKRMPKNPITSPSLPFIDENISPSTFASQLRCSSSDVQPAKRDFGNTAATIFIDLYTVFFSDLQGLANLTIYLTSGDSSAMCVLDSSGIIVKMFDETAVIGHPRNTRVNAYSEK